MKKLFWIFLLIIAAAASYGFWQESRYGTGARDSSAAPSGPTNEIAVIANAVGGTVTFVDIADRSVIGERNVIPDGTRAGFFRDPLQSLAQGWAESEGGLNFAQDTDLSRDGSVLFVSRGFLGDVIAMDIASGDILWRTPIAGIRADHMTISPDGKRLYVAAIIMGGDIVEVIDSESGDRLGSFPSGPWPHDVHVSQDGKRVYVASLGDMLEEEAERSKGGNAYRITVADADSLEVIQEFAFESGIRPFQVTRDESRMFAQLSNTHSIVARDLKGDRSLGRIDLPVADGVSEEDWDFEAPHHGLALSPDETTLCVAGRASDYAAFVSAADLSLVQAIAVGNAPSWAAFAGDGDICLIANTRSDEVSLVSLSELREVARLKTGRGAKHVTIGQVPESVIEQLR